MYFIVVLSLVVAYKTILLLVRTDVTLTTTLDVGGHDKKILIGGDNCMEFSLTGTTFQEGNKILHQSKIKVCHLKTFGKDYEEECQKDFIDLDRKVTIFLKSPSLMWFEGNLVIVLRGEIYYEFLIHVEIAMVSCVTTCM